MLDGNAVFIVEAFWILDADVLEEVKVAVDPCATVENIRGDDDGDVWPLLIEFEMNVGLVALPASIVEEPRTITVVVDVGVPMEDIFGIPDDNVLLFPVFKAACDKWLVSYLTI